MALSLGAAGLGWGMAWRSYRNADKGYVEPIAAAAPPVYDLLLNKYYVDEGYDYVFTGRRKVGDVRLGVMGLGEASSWFDANVVDGAVNGAGWITRLTATVLQLVGQVDHRRHRRERSCDSGAHAQLSRRGCSSGDWCSGMRWS